MTRPSLEGRAGSPLTSERRLPGVRLVLRRSWWVLVGGLIGLAAGVGFTFLQHPTYESTAYLTVVAVGDTNPTSVARAAQALARLGAAPSVVGPSLQEAGLSDAAANPEMFVRVQAAPDASIISVTASAATATEARNIATTVSAALANLPAFDAFRARFVAESQLPLSPTTPRWLAPAGLAGTGVAVALMLAATVAPRRRLDVEADEPVPAERR